MIATSTAAHKIATERSDETFSVVFRGEEIARTRRAVVLYETGLLPVYYIPREDTKMEFLARSALVTRCPYKGLANYFDIVHGENRYSNAIWTYEDPLPATTAIARHLAFYPDRVEIERQPD